LNFDREESEKIARRELVKHIPDLLGDKGGRMERGGTERAQNIFFFFSMKRKYKSSP